MALAPKLKEPGGRERKEGKGKEGEGRGKGGREGGMWASDAPHWGLCTGV